MRLRFSYTELGVRKFFEIRPRETGLSVPIGNVGSHYRIETINDVKYVTHDSWFGDYDRLSTFGSDIQAIGVRSLFEDPWYLRADNMIYDHSVPLADATVLSGQLMHFDSGSGTLLFNAFIRTEYQQGEPVSVFNIGAIWAVSPTGTAPFSAGVCRGANGVYTTDPDLIPRIDFALINITDNTDNYPSILVTVVRGSSDSQNLCYIFDLKFFSGSSPKPTTEDGSRTVTPWGRSGTYNFTSDQMVDVPPSGFSIINRWDHGLTLYHINDYQLAAIQREFWGNETLWGMWINATVKPIQGVITLHKMPVPISSGSSSRALTIFGRRISSGQLLDQIPLINDQLVQYPSDPKWVPIEEIYGDFFDYAGESQLSVHLPFIGTIPLDINAVMNGAIKTVYYFDLLTGNCIARVYGRNGMLNGAELLLYQGSGNAALHIPYCGNDQGGMKMLGSLAGVATAGLAALAIGGAAAAPAMAAITGTSSTVLRERNATVNNIPTECAPLSYPYVCYIMTYPERVLADYEMQMQGWRAASGAAGSSVSDYKGFTAGYVHADISAATDAEKAEIERYFEGGVIL